MTKRELQIYRAGMFYAARLARQVERAEAIAANTSPPTSLAEQAVHAGHALGVRQYRDLIRVRAAELLGR